MALLHRDILITLPHPLSPKALQLVDSPVLPPYGTMVCATNTSLTPLRDPDDTCGPLNVPPGGVSGAAKYEGGF